MSALIPAFSPRRRRIVPSLCETIRDGIVLKIIQQSEDGHNLPPLLGKKAGVREDI
jgi:hypothetical protein